MGLPWNIRRVFLYYGNKIKLKRKKFIIRKQGKKETPTSRKVNLLTVDHNNIIAFMRNGAFPRSVRGIVLKHVLHGKNKLSYSRSAQLVIKSLPRSTELQSHEFAIRKKV